MLQYLHPPELTQWKPHSHTVTHLAPPGAFAKTEEDTALTMYWKFTIIAFYCIPIYQSELEMKDRESLFSTVIHKGTLFQLQANFCCSWPKPSLGTNHGLTAWVGDNRTTAANRHCCSSPHWEKTRTALQLRGFQHSAFSFQCPQISRSGLLAALQLCVVRSVLAVFQGAVIHLQLLMHWWGTCFSMHWRILQAQVFYLVQNLLLYFKARSGFCHRSASTSHPFYEIYVTTQKQVEKEMSADCKTALVKCDAWPQKDPSFLLQNIQCPQHSPSVCAVGADCPGCASFCSWSRSSYTELHFLSQPFWQSLPSFARVPLDLVRHKRANIYYDQ